MALISQQSKIGECEVCEKTDVPITCHYGNMWFCDDCWQMELTAKSQIPVEKKIESFQNSVESKVIEASRLIDNSIEVRPDLFNAATVAIVDIKKAIEENPEITNKPFALAEELLTRFNHYKKVIFEAQEAIMDAGNHQQAIHRYLNQLANSLRQEEREKLRIQDINYKPAPVSKPTVKKISTSQTNKATKLNQAELRKVALELGVAVSTVQMIVVSRGIGIQEAAKVLRDSIAAAKQTT